MKIVIISDTHQQNASSNIMFLAPVLRGADMVIHAGDFTELGTLNYLQEFHSFRGVYGNADSLEIRTKINEKQILDFGAYRLGIFHGHGTNATTIDRAYNAFGEDHVDIIVFGHSHQPVICTKNKVLMLNPGSPTNKRKERWFSYILLNITATGIAANLVLAENIMELDQYQ